MLSTLSSLSQQTPKRLHSISIVKSPVAMLAHVHELVVGVEDHTNQSRMWACEFILINKGNLLRYNFVPCL